MKLRMDNGAKKLPTSRRMNAQLRHNKTFDFKRIYFLFKIKKSGRLTTIATNSILSESEIIVVLRILRIMC